MTVKQRVLLIACAFLIPLGAEAQVTDTLPARPFVRGGVYDRPYLTRLLGRTAIGGYAEMHARWERVDGATEERGFEAKRWNIFTATEVSDLVRISAELEVEEGGEEITLEYAAIDFRIAPGLALRAFSPSVPSNHPQRAQWS